MSIIVEHEKRRREILERALDLFVEEGYGAVTLQKIAGRCGITRTTLYIYFKNKKEIFNYSIKQFLEGLEADILKIRRDKRFTNINKLRKILTEIMERVEENRRLLLVLLDYLTHLPKSGKTPDYQVRRRTVRLRHILATVVIDGIRSGEIAAVKIRDADNLLYSLIETAIFRLTVLRRDNVDDVKQAADLAIKNLQFPQNKLTAQG
ncbi:fatty acid metabolism regulator protein [Spirochaetia bacterium]|nr:fatty acid metabolism regulator protein [Spirochaetia bacterium]